MKEYLSSKSTDNLRYSIHVLKGNKYVSIAEFYASDIPIMEKKFADNPDVMKFLARIK